MSIRLDVLERWMPDTVRRRALDELAAAVCRPLGCAPPPWRAQRFAARLEEFTHLTAERAAAVPVERVAAVRGQLYVAAYRLGAGLRRRLGVRDHDEAMRALVLLYRQIGIELHVSGDAVEIPRCSFSRVYTAAVCRLMSAVDEGLTAGLTGGWRLSFHERLTEHAAACRGTLLPPASLADGARARRAGAGARP